MPSAQNLASGTQKTKSEAYFNYPLKDDSNLLKFKCKKQSTVILNAKKAFPLSQSTVQTGVALSGASFHDCCHGKVTKKSTSTKNLSLKLIV